ncbi:MAG: hypothetical protein HGA65_06250 [Oscillochloris sp.]|nr:hypothetical protein [Oscillochloris sp.]
MRRWNQTAGKRGLTNDPTNIRWQGEVKMACWSASGGRSPRTRATYG